MSPPLPEDVVQKILDDLNSDRYKAGNISLEEIAAIRLGDRKKGGTISKIAKKHKIQLRRQGQSKKNPFQSKPSAKEPRSDKPIKIECFTAKARLSLIDEAITIHKSLLPGVKDPYKMEKWSAALDRLLEQRRIEEPPQTDSEQDMLDKIVGALDKHAAVVSPQASPSISGLPEDPPNPDVRLGEERKDRDSTVLRNQGD